MKYKKYPKPLKYKVSKKEIIDVLRWIKWPKYDFIFGVPDKDNKYKNIEKGFFQYRDRRKKKVRCGFYVDKGELKELYLGFKRLWELYQR